MFELYKKYWRQNSDDCTLYSTATGFGIVIILLSLACSGVVAIIVGLFLGILLRLWWNDFQRWNLVYGGKDE